MAESLDGRHGTQARLRTDADEVASARSRSQAGEPSAAGETEGDDTLRGRPGLRLSVTRTKSRTVAALAEWTGSLVGGRKREVRDPSIELSR